MNKQLIVIDAQEDFTRGVLGNEYAASRLPIIQDLVDYAFLNFDHPTVYTKDTHDHSTYEHSLEKDYDIAPHCINLTKGWQICHEAITERSKIIEKSTFGYAHWDNNCYIPKGIEEIWICGFCTDICVISNFMILRAVFPKIPIIVLEDACAGTSKELHDAAISVIKSCCGEVYNWEEIRMKKEEEEL